MEKTYNEITQELEEHRVVSHYQYIDMQKWRKSPDFWQQPKDVTKAWNETNREITRLENEQFNAYAKERIHSPANSEIYKELKDIMDKPPVEKPAATHWGKHELSFVANYIEENFTRK